MHVGDTIRERREKLGISLTELAQKAAINKGNLSRIEQKGRGFSHDSLQRIADSLKTTPAALLAGTEQIVADINVGKRRIPVWDYTTAAQFVYSSPIENVQDGQRYVLTDHDDSPNTFGLLVTDEAMQPRVRPGFVAIIDRDRTATANSLVAVEYQDRGARLFALRYYHDRGELDGVPRFEAVPENRAYRTLYSDDPDVKLVGTVVELRERL